MQVKVGVRVEVRVRVKVQAQQGLLHLWLFPMSPNVFTDHGAHLEFYV